jgi:hypothetical protein
MIHSHVGMPKHAIRIIGAIPGAATLAPILADFSRKGGMVTSLSDRRLTSLPSLLPESGNVEVLAFGEIVSKYLAFCGELPPRLPQKGHLEAAVAAACDSVSAESPFYGVRSFPGFHRKVERTLAELRGWGIDATEISELASKASGQLKDKLGSLMEIERSVEETLEQLGMATNATRIKQCLTAQPVPGVKLGNLLVIAGPDYEPLQAQLIKWVASQGGRVTVVIGGRPGSLAHGGSSIASAARSSLPEKRTRSRRTCSPARADQDP